MSETCRGMKPGSILKFNENQKSYNGDYFGFICIVVKIVGDRFEYRTSHPHNPSHHRVERSLINDKRFDIIQE